jgi:hypothetical protein
VNEAAVNAEKGKRVYGPAVGKPSQDKSGPNCKTKIDMEVNKMFDYDKAEHIAIEAALKAYPDKTEDDICATFVSPDKATVIFDGRVKFIIEF